MNGFMRIYIMCSVRFISSASDCALSLSLCVQNSAFTVFYLPQLPLTYSKCRACKCFLLFLSQLRLSLSLFPSVRTFSHCTHGHTADGTHILSLSSAHAAHTYLYNNIYNHLFWCSSLLCVPCFSTAMRFLFWFI